MRAHEQSERHATKQKRNELTKKAIPLCNDTTILREKGDNVAAIQRNHCRVSHPKKRRAASESGHVGSM